MNRNLKSRIKRFPRAQRLFHLLLMLSFTVQAWTGLGRMYIETTWGKVLVRAAGGYEASLTVHRAVGIFMLCLFLAHLVYVAMKTDWRRLPGYFTGRDSLLPQPSDLVQFFQHIGWFLGLKGHPRFGRWTYWEKFDYWAVFWGITIMGVTGLLLYNPIASSRVMPGWGLNIALWVHRLEAILAMAHVFTIHFFIAHLRRHNFPLDTAMFEGSVDLEKTRTERPAWVEGMEAEGTLPTALVGRPGTVALAVFHLFGWAVVAAGVFLLINGIVNSPFVTWR